jgi:uncharacterized protein (DUF302 family)
MQNPLDAIGHVIAAKSEEAMMVPEVCMEWLLPLSISQARDHLRRAFKEFALVVCCEADLSDAVHRATGVRSPRVVVLGVVCPFQLLEAMVADRNAPLLLPLHLVISEQEQEVVRIRLVSSAGLRTFGLPPALASPVHRTLALIVESITSSGASRVVPGSAQLIVGSGRWDTGVGAL